MRSASASTISFCSFEVFVEQQVQLIERGAGRLPVVLLVEVAECHRVGQHLVQIGHALLAHVLSQRNRQLHEVSVGLDLVRVLMGQRFRLAQNRIRI